MSKQEKILNKIILVALFSALCCAATFIQIRMPSGDFIHLGNFVMIMVALLLGGIEGGLVGSLGMGLYDLIFYTSKPSTIIRTFVLKFLVGYIVGTLFRFILKRKIKTNILLYVTTFIFAGLFIFTLVFFCIGDKSNLSFKTGLNSVVSNFFGSGKNVSFSLYLPIFTGIATLGTLMASIFSAKLSERNKAVLFSITIAILVNIIGEFLLRWLLEGILLDGFDKSLIVATSKIPGSLITGVISVTLAVLIYEPVYRGVKNSAMFKDDTILEENTSLENNVKDEEEK